MADNKKVVEIISVGSDLLLGNVVNTNAAFLAKEVTKLGFSCYYLTTVGNNEKSIQEAFHNAVARADVVIFSGGMGPSKDDITKETVSKLCGKALVMHEDTKVRVEEYYTKHEMKIPNAIEKLSLVPMDSEVLANDNGVAVGLILKKDGKNVFLLPGHPGSLRPVFLDKAVPYLEAILDYHIVSKTIKLISVTESAVKTMIWDMYSSQTNPTISIYAMDGEVHIGLTAKGETEAECEKLIKPVVRELKLKFGNSIYTTDENVSLDKSVIDLLGTCGFRATTVESCTAGMVAARLVNVPGASEVFKYGLVTYSNKAKRKLAGVKKSTLEKYTAVSPETAAEMVKGIEWGPRADVIVGVTGYASQGDDNQPAGLVYIACNTCGETTVKEYHFDGDRAKVRESATTEAIALMRECILKHLSKTQFK